jgi:hypothetical protein
VHVSDSDGAHRGGDREEPRGKTDLVSILYILGGIPAIVLYVVLSFVLARYFDFPA